MIYATAKQQKNPKGDGGLRFGLRSRQITTRTGSSCSAKHFSIFNNDRAKL